MLGCKLRTVSVQSFPFLTTLYGEQNKNGVIFKWEVRNGFGLVQIKDGDAWTEIDR